MLELSSSWQRVSTRGKSDVYYPAPAMRFRWRRQRRDLEPQYSGPAVYRWVLSGKDANCQYLVGETHDLRERYNSYVTSTVPAHENIREIFDSYRKAGGTIGLETLKFESLTINGTILSADGLNDKDFRRALEAICQARFVKEETLLPVKAHWLLVKALNRKLTIEQVKKIIDEVGGKL
jgi:hypothetical protein